MDDPRAWAELGDEDRVIRAFCSYLVSEGWQDVAREIAFVDVEATRDGTRLRAEVKGETAGNKRKNVDSLYGQLLRRMQQEDDPSVRYALVVPASSRVAALDVPTRVRKQLRITVYVVEKDGTVSEVG